jgi:hypothetical protein
MMSEETCMTGRRISIVSALVAGFAVTANAQVDTSGLIGYYKLDDSAGSSVAADSSVSGYHGSVVDNSTAPSTFGVPGKVGTAWQTDTAPETWPDMLGDFISLPNGTGGELRLGGDSYSLTGWVKAVDLQTSGNTHLFSSSISPGLDGVTVSFFTGVHFGVLTSNETSIVLSVPNSNLFEMFEPTTGMGLIDTSFWHFWAVTFEGSTSNTAIYFVREDQNFADGDSDVATTGPSMGLTSPRIGRPAGPGGFDGIWDEMTIWTRPLSDTEVQELFELGVAGNPLPEQTVPTVNFNPVPVAHTASFDMETRLGRDSQLQYTTDPVGGSWTDTDFVVLGNGGVRSATVNAGPDASRIWRFVILP